MMFRTYRYFKHHTSSPLYFLGGLDKDIWNLIIYNKLIAETIENKKVSDSRSEKDAFARMRFRHRCYLALQKILNSFEFCFESPLLHHIAENPDPRIFNNKRKNSVRHRHLDTDPHRFGMFNRIIKHFRKSICKNTPHILREIFESRESFFNLNKHLMLFKTFVLKSFRITNRKYLLMCFRILRKYIKCPF